MKKIKKEKEIVIKLTYNQSLKLYQGGQFLRVKRNCEVYYINYYSYLGKYVAQSWLGRIYDNVEVIGHF